MLDEKTKRNIIKSSYLYFMDVLSFSDHESKFKSYVTKQFNIFIEKQSNHNLEKIANDFFEYLENKLIEIIPKKITLAKNIGIVQSMIKFIIENPKYDDYTKLQKISMFFTNKLRSEEQYLKVLKDHESILKVISASIDLTKTYEEVVDEQQKQMRNLIAQDKKVRSFIEDYCISNDIDTMDLFLDNEIKHIINSYKSSSGSKSSNNKKLLTKEEQLELVRQYQNGSRDALTKLIEGNIRLVISIAGHYVNRGLDFEDLVQIGCMGMITAIEKFDLTNYSHIRFSTYAYPWIRQAIGREIGNTAKTIRLPIHMEKRKNKVYNVSEKLTKRLGRTPTDEEIAKEMGVSPIYVKETHRIPDTTSLDQTVGDEDTSALIELIGDKTAVSPEEYVEITDTIEEIEFFLTKLKKPRTAEVLRMRFGLGGYKAMTLDAVGKHFNISRERIRQLEAKGLKELRALMEKAKKHPDIYGVRAIQQRKPEIEEINFLLSQLKERRTEEVLRMRFGLGGNKAMTLEDVGKHFNVTKERIRQIEDKGLKELKAIIQKSNKHPELYNLITASREQPSNNDKKINDKDKKEKEKITMGRRLQSIYETLKEYKREEIDAAIASLSEEDKQLLIARYGADLENPVQNSNLTEKQRQQFYQGLLKRIRKQLEGETSSKNQTKTDTSQVDPKKSNSKPTKNTKVKTEKTTTTNDTPKASNQPNIKNTVKNETPEKTLPKTEQPNNDLLFGDVFQHQFFKERVKQLPLEQIVIISLKLGYVHAENEPIKTETIAKLLGMEEEQVNTITKNVLNTFKSELVSLLDTSTKSTHDVFYEVDSSSDYQQESTQMSEGRQLAIRLESPNPAGNTSK